MPCLRCALCQSASPFQNKLHSARNINKKINEPANVENPKSYIIRIVYQISIAERVRFELTMPCGMPVFETGALDHSATPPVSIVYRTLKQSGNAELASTYRRSSHKAHATISSLRSESDTKSPRAFVSTQPLLQTKITLAFLPKNARIFNVN